MDKQVSSALLLHIELHYAWVGSNDGATNLSLGLKLQLPD
jgi:hypothetical protein